MNFVVILLGLILAQGCKSQRAHSRIYSQDAAPVQNTVQVHRCDGNTVRGAPRGGVECSKTVVRAVKVDVSGGGLKAEGPVDRICPEGYSLIYSLGGFATKQETQLFYCGARTEVRTIFPPTCDGRRGPAVERPAVERLSDGSGYTIHCACDRFVWEKPQVESPTPGEVDNSRAGELLSIDYAMAERGFCVDGDLAGKLAMDAAGFGLTEKSNSDEESKDYLRNTHAELEAVQEGRVGDYYRSRLQRGDRYAELAIDVSRGRSILGVAAGHWLRLQIRFLRKAERQRLLNGRNTDEYVEYISRQLAIAHARAVDEDYYGRPGLLSADQISDYHEKLFVSQGLSKNTFGGSSLGFRTKYWCKGCDPVP